MPLDLTDDKSTLVQVMAWCRQATSHYLSQCWPSSMWPYGVTRPQWVKSLQLMYACPFLKMSCRLFYRAGYQGSSPSSGYQATFTMFVSDKRVYASVNWDTHFSVLNFTDKLLSHANAVYYVFFFPNEKILCLFHTYKIVVESKHSDLNKERYLVNPHVLNFQSNFVSNIFKSAQESLMQTNSTIICKMWGFASSGWNAGWYTYRRYPKYTWTTHPLGRCADERKDHLCSQKCTRDGEPNLGCVISAIYKIGKSVICTLLTVNVH